MAVLSFNLKIKKSVKRAAKPDLTWLTKELSTPAFNQAYKKAKSVAETPVEYTVSQALKTISASLLEAVNTAVPASKRAKTKRRERSEHTIKLFDERARKLQSMQEFSPEFRLQKKLYTRRRLLTRAEMITERGWKGSPKGWRRQMIRETIEQFKQEFTCSLGRRSSGLSSNLGATQTASRLRYLETSSRSGKSSVERSLVGHTESVIDQLHLHSHLHTFVRETYQQTRSSRCA
jgi:hypothetical protein